MNPAQSVLDPAAGRCRDTTHVSATPWLSTRQPPTLAFSSPPPDPHLAFSSASSGPDLASSAAAIMMFPFALRSTYSQYKEDTDAVASWLARTARRCGYTGKLSRAKAKKNAKQPATQPKHYLVSTSAFTTLAKYIAESKDPVAEASSTFVEALDRAISLRREFSRSMANLNKINRPSTKAHAHFVSVLEEVKRILRNLKTTPLKEDRASKLTNSFSALAVQEPAESQPDASSTNGMAEPEPEPEFEADQFEDPNELYIAFKLLVEDVHSIRKAVKEIWAGYGGGKYRSVAAALATNTAIDFARGLEEDISPVIEKYGGFKKIYIGWWHAICNTQGHGVNERQEPGDDMNFLAYDDADTVMFPTFRLLESFLDVVKEDLSTIPIAKPGFYGRVDYTGDWESKTSRQKWQSDKSLLLQVLGSLSAVIRLAGNGGQGVLAEDELIRGLSIAIKTREVHLWNILAAQILLDIHHILREDVFRPFQELHAVGEHLTQSIDKNLGTKTQHPNWPRSNDQALREIRDIAHDWVIVDSVKNNLRRVGCPVLPESHYYFKNNPVFCGLFQYSLQMRFHIVSVDFVNAWGSVLYARHLYNILKQEKLLTNKWEDMELLSMLQPDSVAFGGNAPTDREGFLKRYAIMMGAPASSFTPDARRTSLQPGYGRTGVEHQVPLARVFMHRYCELSGRVDFTPDEVKKILEKIITHPHELQQARRLTTARWFARARALRRLTIPELLEKLATALMGETGAPEFQFDYLQMHFTSWSMLELANRICNAQLQRLFIPEYLTHDSQLPCVVGYFLFALRDVGKHPDDIYVNPRTGALTSDVVAKAGATWNTIFSARGKKAIGCLVTELLKGTYNIHFRIE
ncbi:hypothetical protein HDK90DRAFT_466052 [Phyllosticta capitalensis]|uniref:DUF6604 domain-containing protein n=1 Tax=Phyllosticta capitalensis TaxID=121624 RepID=A0ABR1YRX4_9PEZI